MRQSPLVLHDAFTFPGGGEIVAACLAREFQAMLWTAELMPSAFPNDFFGLRPLMDMRAPERYPRLARISRTACHWRCFKQFTRTQTPFALFSGQLALMAHKRIQGAKILYCHTPPRILYDQRKFYLSLVPKLKRPLYQAFLQAYQISYSRAAHAMDTIVANSRNVAARLRRYLSLDSVVVYPPVKTKEFVWLGQEDYYLSTARVDQLKRVEMVVEAFLNMPEKRLVVVSGGSELEKVRAMAKDRKNITVLGWVSPEKLRELIGKCLATIYIPRDEDFGISPVESMAAGKPVIGVAEGGLLETVQDYRTGLLLQPDLSIPTLVRAIQAMTAHKAQSMRQDCENQAKRFDESVFTARMRAVVEETLKRRAKA